MKKLLVALALLFSFTAVAQIKPDYSKIPAHPRLFLKAGDIEAVRNKITTDVPFRTIHSHIENYTENKIMYATPSVFKKQGKRLLGVSRRVLERVYYCSYLYLVTGNEKYARRAEEEMLSAAKFESWNPSHFLDVAEMMAALATGYDWLYNWLSPESRRIIEDAIIEKGLRAANPKMWWYRSTNNWNQVCNGGMIMGALAVYERIPEEAQALIERSLEGNPRAQECYGPDGVYPEGFGYWEYGTWYQVMLIEALRTSLGTSFDLEKAPGFLESARYMNFMRAPSGQVFNFADCGNARDGINPLLYWFAIESGDMSLLYLDRERNLTRGINRQTPLALLFAARCDLSNIKPIKEKFWSGNGEQPIAIYRSGFDSKEDTYFAVKGGSPMGNHAHMDSGSFVYEWGGVRWAMDLGMQNYYSLESKGVALWKKHQNSGRWRVFRIGNFSHNNITVNEQLHRVKGMATMDKVYNTKSRHGAKFNLTSLFTEFSSAFRTIYIDKNDKVVCIDELVAQNTECNVRWNMCTAAKPEIIDDRTISLTQNGKEIIVRLASPAKGKAYIMSNAPTTHYDCENKGTCRIGFAVKVAPSSKCNLKVELIPQK